MRKGLLASLLLGALGLLGWGCGSGYSTSRATQQCDSEKQARADCWDDGSYTTCLSCYEDCGDDCVPAACPVRYACPGDQNTTSTSTGVPPGE